MVSGIVVIIYALVVQPELGIRQRGDDESGCPTKMVPVLLNFCLPLYFLALFEPLPPVIVNLQSDLISLDSRFETKRWQQPFRMMKERM
jgi:hypothetical protein